MQILFLFLFGCVEPKAFSATVTESPELKCPYEGFLYQEPLFIPGPIRLGPHIMQGSHGSVYNVQGDESSVVKVYEGSEISDFFAPGSPKARPETENRAYKYALLHRLLGENAIACRGYGEIHPGVFGILLEKIPVEYRQFQDEKVTPRTLQDLERIHKTLARHGLSIWNFQITVDPTGKVIVFDADGLVAEDNNPHLIPLPGKTRESAQEQFEIDYQNWLTRSREALAAKERK